MIQLLWRTVWRFLKKLKIELPYDPAIPLLGLYTEKTITQKDTCEASFKMAEEQYVEITFLPTNTSEIHLHVEQPLQKTY